MKRILPALVLLLAVSPVSAAPVKGSIAWQPGLVIHFGDVIAIGDAITWTAPVDGVSVAELRVYLEGAEPSDETVICNVTSVLVPGYVQSFQPFAFGPTQVWQSGGGTAQVRLVTYRNGHYRLLAATDLLTVLPVAMVS